MAFVLLISLFVLLAIGVPVAFSLGLVGVIAVALLACSRNGYICSPSLHRDHTVGDIMTLIKRMRAAAVIFEEGYGADAARHDFSEALQSVETIKKTYCLAPLDENQRGESLFHGILTEDNDMLPVPSVETPDAPVYLAFTSGSTGEPKGVLHSSNTLLANSRSIVSDWSMNSGSAIYTLSPLSHNLGFGAMINALTVGGTLVVHDMPKGASLAERLQETNASFLFGVPTHAIDLLNELDRRSDVRLDKLMGFRVSGAPVPDDVCKRLLLHGIIPQSGYGMTEACSHHYTMPDDDPAMIVQTSGRACPGYEIRIFDRDNPDNEVKVGEIGQIGGRGASLMLGYFNDQTATEDSFNPAGWFMTGDLGWMDEKGYLRVTGRKKDVIIRGGHNIFPARIEALAIRHPALDKVAAVPVEDTRLGERVCLVVVLQDDAVVEISEVLDHLDAAGLSKYDMPEYFVSLSEMPLTSSGKVLKRELIEWIRSGKVKPESVRFQRGKPASDESQNIEENA